MGASAFQYATGFWVQTTHNYHGPFLCAGLTYLVSLTIMHLISPNFQPAILPVDPNSPIAETDKKDLHESLAPR